VLYLVVLPHRDKGVALLQVSMRAVKLGSVERISTKESVHVLHTCVQYDQGTRLLQCSQIEELLHLLMNGSKRNTGMHMPQSPCLLKLVASQVPCSCKGTLRRNFMQGTLSTV
jgi:hypothetical protein